MPEPSRSSGTFGRGGDRRVRATIEFVGTIERSFDAFVRKKAAQLSLDVQLERTSDGITLTTEGSEALIGALEMSAVIGPEDCRITDWTITVREVQNTQSAPD